MNPAPRLWNLVAELTYRCPLRCPYCSNPTRLGDFPERLSADDWGRVFRESRSLGAVHVGLTGGEPSARADLPEIVALAHDAGLYTHLVTAAHPLDPEGLRGLAKRGLASVQISLQDAFADASDAIAGTPSFERKLALCRATRELGLPLTLNVVLHRRNLGNTRAIIERARELDADRLELANTQYLGWALTNRDALLPSREALESARRVVERESQRSLRPEILFVLPDYFRKRPKACSAGWGQRHLIVTPNGRALPCHGASELDLPFWNVTEHSVEACWRDAPGMNAFRGEGWMQEPCRSCPERERDFGGCRCQAFALVGDAAATDPACELSPHHDRIVSAREQACEAADAAWIPRGPGLAE
ncbi:MAG: pyrroloquinoline quinone biosynthesis protein PqqE [Myxococcota bacterium]|nr:pyrroloquinoline quinone biosynthesis protein PqqE [Myxococcota bacterium]